MLDLERLSTGVQHLGLPTNDIEATIDFYRQLGFSVALRTVNEAAKEQVAFLKLKNLTIETYETGAASGVPGAIDHIALDVADVEEVFHGAKEAGLNLLHREVQFLPFWERGVRFFTIQGPNGEKLEFSQMM